MMQENQENQELKACLRGFIEAIVLCGRDGEGHIDNELVRKSMELCGMDERLVEFIEEEEDE